MKIEFNSFFKEIQHAYNNGLPFVVFRKPNEKVVNTYIQNSNKLNELSSYIDSGFVFAPFTNNEKKIFFPLSQCSYKSLVIKNVSELNTNKDSNKTNFSKQSVLLKEHHINLVQKGIDFINDTKVDKVVLSRCESVEVNKFDIFDTYKKILKKYESAFAYLWYHPKIGLWMGATPERLINVEQHNFKTMSLAGTQEYKGTVGVLWEHKEIREQEIVTNYILDNLSDNVDNVKIDGPKTIKAGNLLHLKTDITGRLKSADLLENLINSLHPTPAVCGLPKKESKIFIIENENYNRAYYAGYLGEINIENKTNLFVNLRCMQVQNSFVKIYVGGGITSKSYALKEWEETVAKAEVMKRVL